MRRTVLLLINVIAEYCVRAEEITLSAKCLLRYLVELLQLFNRKSCKLVLGGEAVSEKTGLKKITSSNLALLMRALQLLLCLIPLIRTHFSSNCLLLINYHSYRDQWKSTPFCFHQMSFNHVPMQFFQKFSRCTSKTF